MRRLSFIIFFILPLFTRAEFSSGDSAKLGEINSRLTDVWHESLDINSNSSLIKNNTDTIISKLSTIFTELNSGLNGLLTNTSSESSRSYYKLFFVNPQYDDGKGNTTSWASAIQRLLYHINNAVTTNKIDLTGITITNTVDHSQVLDDIKYEVEGLNETFSENFYNDYKLDSEDWSDWRDSSQQFFGNNTNILGDISISSSFQTNQLSHISDTFDSTTNTITSILSTINSWDKFYNGFTNHTYTFPYGSSAYRATTFGSSVLVYQQPLTPKNISNFFDFIESFGLETSELLHSSQNFLYLLHNDILTNNLYTANINRTIDGFTYLTNSTLQYVLNPNNFDRQSYFTPQYYYKGANLADPAKIDNQIQQNDLSGLFYNINRFIPNTQASINNYLNDFYVRGIKLRDFNYTNLVEVAVTNIIEFAYTNNLDLAFTNQIYDIASNTSNILDSVDFIAHISSNLLYDVGYSITNFVETILSLEMSSPLIDYSPSNDDTVFTYLTNYYYMVSTGQASSTMTHTNWFNRVEMLLASIVFGSGGNSSTNFFDESSYDSDIQNIDNSLKQLADGESITANLDAVNDGLYTIQGLVEQLRGLVSDFSLPSSFTLFDVDLSAAKNRKSLVENDTAITIKSDLTQNDALFFDLVHNLFRFIWSLIGFILVVVYTYKLIKCICLTLSVAFDFLSS